MSAFVLSNQLEIKHFNQPFKERLKTLKDHANQHFHLQLKEQDKRNKWTRELQQELHICHMFLYNRYQHQHPKGTKERETIPWDTFQKPNVAWGDATVKLDPFKFLRTKTGGIPALTMDKKAWMAGYEPEINATKKNLLEAFMAPHKLGSSMIAPGISGCAYPCGCGGHASKHATGDATDMVYMDLERVAKAVAENDPALALNPSSYVIDRYLAYFGLWRPLKDAKDSNERWHLEATPHGYDFFRVLWTGPDQVPHAARNIASC